MFLVRRGDARTFDWSRCMGGCAAGFDCSTQQRGVGLWWCDGQRGEDDFAAERFARCEQHGGLQRGEAKGAGGVDAGWFRRLGFGARGVGVCLVQGQACVGVHATGNVDCEDGWARRGGGFCARAVESVEACGCEQLHAAQREAREGATEACAEHGIDDERGRGERGGEHSRGARRRGGEQRHAREPGATHLQCAEGLKTRTRSDEEHDNGQIGRGEQPGADRAVASIVAWAYEDDDWAR